MRLVVWFGAEPLTTREQIDARPPNALHHDGELVDRLGVGIDDGAHLDAPSSLSGRPARQR
jgi:hypothetical protein